MPGLHFARRLPVGWFLRVESSHAAPARGIPRQASRCSDRVTNGSVTMQTIINGKPARIDPATMVLTLAAAMRVLVCRELKRLRAEDYLSPDGERRRAELEAELQTLDEIAHDARQAAA